MPSEGEPTLTPFANEPLPYLEHPSPWNCTTIALTGIAQMSHPQRGLSSTSLSSSFFISLHSTSHYLTLCLYVPFIFSLFPYLGVELDVDRVFVLLSVAFSLPGTQ